jgi:hypothetical protein
MNVKNLLKNVFLKKNIDLSNYPKNNIIILYKIIL